MLNKKINHIHSNTAMHWVGDGFPVSSIFSYQDKNAALSPFLLLDYAGPAQFEPSNKTRGVELHPHRGIETVTVVYEGEVEHKDNAGHSGKIGKGDVQWMTAASGILHEEKHSKEFTQNGGILEMVQLWVNLPAKDKMTKPKYQTILKDDIAEIELDNDAGELRVIAGEYQHAKGKANTFTPINVWDIQLTANKSINLELPKGHNALLLVLSGQLTADGYSVSSRELIEFSNEGENIHFEVKENTRALLMTGTPIDEPIVGRGPFVMNTIDEIRQAYRDYAEGKF